MTDFKKKEFVVLDVETTGLSPAAGDRIIEIAALKVKNLKPVDKFYSFVDPQREISFGAFQVNGISQDMLLGAPTSPEILPRFLDFIGHNTLLGHNVAFDLNFLCYELSSIGRYLNEERVVIDTLKMARGLLPHLGRYPLWFVAESLGIGRNQEHRAMGDVELTFDVFRGLLKTMGKKDIGEIGVLPGILKGYNAVNRKKEEGIFNC